MNVYPLTNLLGEYCERMDTADFDGVGALFADGRLCDEHGNVLAEGAGAVAEFYRSTVLLHDGSPRTKHLVLNPIVDLAEGTAPTQASVRSSYLVLQGLDGVLRPMICGRYHDAFTRAPMGWHFTERRFFVDLAGDLSRHLGFSI